MGVSNERIKHLPDIQNKTTESGDVSWKTVLKDILATPSDRTDSQRCWAELTSQLRQLCPETHWVFIRQEDKEMNEAPFLQGLQQWLLNLVNTPEWPLPARAFVCADGEGKSRSWRVSFPRSAGPLPVMAAASTTLTVVPWGDEHSHGWKIHNIAPFSLDKAGKA